MHTETTTIGIVEDHTMYRKGMILLINQFKNCKVILEAGNGKELQQELKKGIVPDILLLDLRMPVMDGFETIDWLHKSHPGLPVIIISMCHSELTIVRLVQSGAKAFLKKNMCEKELQRAISTVKEKGFYYTSSTMPRLFTTLYRTDKNEMNQYKLTEKEQRFLQLACSELTYKEIAGEMKISERCVDKMRDHMFIKLGAKNRVGLTMTAIGNGIVNPFK